MIIKTFLHFTQLFGPYYDYMILQIIKKGGLQLGKTKVTPKQSS